MVLLLVDALRERVDARDPSSRHRLVVPFYLNLAGWRPEKAALLEHAVKMMRERHSTLRGMHKKAVRELIESGRLALFLDGCGSSGVTHVGA
jgi:hypothetical protein